MTNGKSVGLGAIAAGHAAEIEGLFAAIQTGGSPWSLRPVVRKDDPPEEEDPS